MYTYYTCVNNRLVVQQIVRRFTTVLFIHSICYRVRNIRLWFVTDPQWGKIITSWPGVEYVYNRPDVSRNYHVPNVVCNKLSTSYRFFYHGHFNVFSSISFFKAKCLSITWEMSPFAVLVIISRTQTRNFCLFLCVSWYFYRSSFRNNKFWSSPCFFCTCATSSPWYHRRYIWIQTHLIW